MNIGCTGKATVRVTAENTAQSVGSGLLPVFSTPSMIALIEMAACNAIADSLEEGTSSVGTHLDVKHLAATPIGMSVTATASLIEADGRRLVFKVEVRDDAGLIGEGAHERFIVYSEKFLSKANSKLNK